jgi:hypothetical protein
MIKDNSLANRLNAVKKGEKIPKDINEEKTLHPINPVLENREYEDEASLTIKEMFISSIFNLAEIGIMSFFYGFGVKTLMSQDWSILGILGVGLLTNQIISLIFRLKLFNQ